MPDAMPQTINPSRARFTWEPMALVHQSPESGAENRVDMWGRWHAIFDYVYAGDSLIELITFLEKVGLTTSFTILHPLRRNPRETWSWASGAVRGVGQTGTTLETDGWPSAISIFKAGDLIELVNTGQVLRVAVDVSATFDDPDYVATIPLVQPIRNSPDDNSEVRVVDPRFTMVLVRPVVDEMPGEGDLSSYHVEMREDV